MNDVQIITRAWMIGVDKYALESSPMAREFAERQLDITVAASVQSLKETRDELGRISEEIVNLVAQYDEASKGFHRSAMYKGKMEAFQEFLNIIAREIRAYDQRIVNNRKNDGRQENRL